MKKHLLLLGLTSILMIGSQLSFAQNSEINSSAIVHNLENTAKDNTIKVIDAMERQGKLTSSQKSKLFDTFEAAQTKVINTKAENNSLSSAMKNEIQVFINKNLKEILSTEQYNLLLEKMTAN